MASRLSLSEAFKSVFGDSGGISDFTGSSFFFGDKGLFFTGGLGGSLSADLTYLRF